MLGREVLPFLAAFAALAASALLLDAILHLLGAAWVGRYLGIPGVLLIIASFGYSLRKRQVIKLGKPLVLLHAHERMAWLDRFNPGPCWRPLHGGPGLARHPSDAHQCRKRADRQIPAAEGSSAT